MSKLKRYALLTRLLSDFQALPIAQFDAGAASSFEQLQAQRLQLAKMDARIAAIALSRNMILLTRNQQDFSKVSGLALEDWTV